MEAPPPKKQINVVGAVVLRDGLVLCAQRGPGALEGMWEFPGGKIEPNETARDALAREIDEELHCTVKVGPEVVTTTHEYDFGVVTLTTFYCNVLDGEPQLTEHTEVRWERPSKLHLLDWAPADIPAVAKIQADFA
jgi:8-oxo-dGTP diphosphatase